MIIVSENNLLRGWTKYYVHFDIKNVQRVKQVKIETLRDSFLVRQLIWRENWQYYHFIPNNQDELLVSLIWRKNIAVICDAVDEIIVKNLKTFDNDLT